MRESGVRIIHKTTTQLPSSSSSTATTIITTTTTTTTIQLLSSSSPTTATAATTITSLLCYDPRPWNELPDNVKASDSVQNFTTQLKTLLFRKGLILPYLDC